MKGGWSERIEEKAANRHWGERVGRTHCLWNKAGLPAAPLDARIGP